MVFHVPDPAVRAGRAGCFLYPYAETTPGPVTTTTAQVADHLKDLEQLARRRAGRAMARFNARFNDHCDGRAGRPRGGRGVRHRLRPAHPGPAAPQPTPRTRPRMRVVRGRS